MIVIVSVFTFNACETVIDDGGNDDREIVFIQGPAGEKGEQGENGIDGDDGTDGAAGPQGPQGDTGQDGEGGLMGREGPQGEKGEQGDPGEDGEDFQSCLEDFVCPDGYFCNPQGICLLETGEGMPEEDVCDPHLFPDGTYMTSWIQVETQPFWIHNQVQDDMFGLQNLITGFGDLNMVDQCGSGFIVSKVAFTMMNLPEAAPEHARFALEIVNEGSWWGNCEPYWDSLNQEHNLTCTVDNLSATVSLSDVNGVRFHVLMLDLPTIPVNHPVYLSVMVEFEDIDTGNVTQVFHSINQKSWSN